MNITFRRDPYNFRPRINKIGSVKDREQKEKGTKLKLKAILATDRGIPRKGMQVKDLAGAVIGEVTSGTFSPALKKGIGLASIDSNVKKNDQVLIDICGTDSTFQVVSLPFVPSKVR